MSDTEKPDLATLTVQLLSAYFANNTVPAADIPGIIETTRTALAGEQAAPAPAEPEHVPAVSVRKSLASRDHIVSMIDGKSYKMLKRHLATNGLTPDEYRARYKLPKTYPMVAPNYAEQRRAVAAKIGLGQRRSPAKLAEAPAPTSSETKPVAVAAAPKRAPAKKAAAPSKADPKTAPTEAAPAPKAKATPAPKAPAKPKVSDAPESVVEAKKPATSRKSAPKPGPRAKRGTKAEPVAAPAE